VGGFVGTILAGVFASEIFGGLQGDLAIGSQVATQLGATLITAAYTAAATFVLLKVRGMIVELCVDQQDEAMGLDLSLHNETGYNL